MSERSAATRIAAATLAVGAVLFGLACGRDPGYARLRPAGAPVATRHQDAAAFVVEAAPFSMVELRVNGRRAATASVPWNAREVRFDGTPLDSGANVVEARTTLWYAASKLTHTATLVVHNPRRPAAGVATKITSAAARPATRNRRALTLSIREQQLSAAFAVELPSRDPAVIALRRGRIGLNTFVDDVFDAVRLNHTWVARFFARARPRISAAPGAVTVSAASEYRALPLEELPALHGELEIASARNDPASGVAGGGARNAREWARDTLRLHFDDYRVVSVQPAAHRDGTALAWEQPFTDPRAHVIVTISFAPFSSVDALRRGLLLPVFAFVPHVAARFLAFFHGFVIAVPMFAYLVLSRGRNPRLASIARRLIAVAVAADVFDACVSAQPDVDGELALIAPMIRALPSPLANLLIVPSVVGLTLAGLAWSVQQIAARDRARTNHVVADAASAVRVAALGFVAVVSVGYAGGNVAGFAASPALVGAILAATSIGFLTTIGWWSLVPQGRWRAAFIVATVAFVAAVAVPGTQTPAGEWAGVAGTAFADPLSPPALTAAFLRSAAPLMPLLFALLMLGALWSDENALGLDAASFLRLAFTSYAVLAGVVVVVPFGFILAWAAYGVLVKRRARAVGVDGAPIDLRREPASTAIPLALVFVLAAVPALLLIHVSYLRALSTPFVALEASGFVAVIAASLLLPGFAFVACSDAIRGDSGLRKGINTAAWVVACSLPAVFLRSENAMIAVALVTIIALWYVLLGRLVAAPGPALGWKLPRRAMIAAAARRE